MSRRVGYVPELSVRVDALVARLHRVDGFLCLFLRFLLFFLRFFRLLLLLLFRLLLLLLFRLLFLLLFRLLLLSCRLLLLLLFRLLLLSTLRHSPRRAERHLQQLLLLGTQFLRVLHAHLHEQPPELPLLPVHRHAQALHAPYGARRQQIALQRLQPHGLAAQVPQLEAGMRERVKQRNLRAHEQVTAAPAEYGVRNLVDVEHDVARLHVRVLVRCAAQHHLLPVVHAWLDGDGHVLTHALHLLAVARLALVLAADAAALAAALGTHRLRLRHHAHHHRRLHNEALAVAARTALHGVRLGCAHATPSGRDCAITPCTPCRACCG